MTPRPWKSLPKSSFAFHPFLFGLYPVLTLYLFNISEVDLFAIQKPLITSCLILFGLALVFLAAARSWGRAALLASLTVLLFYSYGHVLDALNSSVFSSGEPVRHRHLAPVWFLLFLAGLAWSWKLKDLSRITRVLNSISLVLLAAVSLQILVSPGISPTSRADIKEEPAQTGSLLVDTTDRDVYYILLDAYGRQDLLAEDYQLDIGDFVAELEQLGFYFPSCTQSNYNLTTAAMVSTLNMHYLESLGLRYGDNRNKAAVLIKHSQVRALFESLGYDTVTFESLFRWMNIEDATYHFDYFASESKMENLASLNFQYLFLRTTALRPLLQWLDTRPDIRISSFWASWLPVNNTLQSREYKQYQQNLFALDSLETIPSLPGKKFVYAHLFITHQPYVFYPDGRFHPFLLQTDAAYKDQIIFVNSRLVPIIKKILAESEQEPVIILQGDHSFSEGEKRVRILNAYYFPDGGSKNLYDTITPVNTFRVLFNSYYDGNYEILPDISWYTEYFIEENEKENSRSPGELLLAAPNCIGDAKP